MDVRRGGAADRNVGFNNVSRLGTSVAGDELDKLAVDLRHLAHTDLLRNGDAIGGDFELGGQVFTVVEVLRLGSQRREHAAGSRRIGKLASRHTALESDRSGKHCTAQRFSCRQMGIAVDISNACWAAK